MFTPRTLQVLVELADAETGAAIWSRGFDGAGGLGLNGATLVSAMIVNSIVPELREHEWRRQRGARHDLDVHQLVLRARMLISTHRQADKLEARQAIQAAIARDPASSVAHEIASHCHRLTASHGWSDDPRQDRRLQEHHITQAIALDNENADALAYAGHMRIAHHRDYDAGLALLERARAVAPNFPKPWEVSCIVMSWLGDGQAAISHGERALQLAPFDPMECHIAAALCMAHYTHGSYESALSWGYRSHAALPRPGLFLLFAAASAGALGRSAEAERILDLRLPEHPRVSARAFAQAYKYREEAHRDRLEQHLREAGCPV